MNESGSEYTTDVSILLIRYVFVQCLYDLCTSPKTSNYVTHTLENLSVQHEYA